MEDVLRRRSPPPPLPLGRSFQALLVEVVPPAELRVRPRTRQASAPLTFLLLRVAVVVAVEVVELVVARQAVSPHSQPVAERRP